MMMIIGGCAVVTTFYQGQMSMVHRGGAIVFERVRTANAENVSFNVIRIRIRIRMAFL